jgi:hypothetical protein
VRTPLVEVAGFNFVGARRPYGDPTVTCGDPTVTLRVTCGDPRPENPTEPTMSGGGPHLCFYSTKCRYSQAFLEELARTPYAKEFRFVCVDVGPTGTRPALPPYVKAVPTLMIAGEADARTDSAVMNWLSERRLKERQSVAVATPMGTVQRGGPPAAGAAAEAEGPSAFDGFGMAGTCDEGFAFLSEVTSATTARITGNMASIHDMSSMTGPTQKGSVVPGTGAASSAAPPMTAKAKAIDDRLEALRAARDRDLPGPPQRR